MLGAERGQGTGVRLTWWYERAGFRGVSATAENDVFYGCRLFCVRRLTFEGSPSFPESGATATLLEARYRRETESALRVFRLVLTLCMAMGSGFTCVLYATDYAPTVYVYGPSCATHLLIFAAMYFIPGHGNALVLIEFIWFWGAFARLTARNGCAVA